MKLSNEITKKAFSLKFYNYAELENYAKKRGLDDWEILKTHEYFFEQGLYNLNPEPMFKPGELVNPYNKHVLDRVEVDAYNRYTEEINRHRWPSENEFFRNQRHRFFVSCGPGGLIC